MLKIWVGNYNKENGLGKPDWWFNSHFDAKYTATEFSRQLIKDCSDGSEVIAPGAFKHPYRGYYSLDKLPTGVKTTLIAVYANEMIPNLLFCGDNCVRHLIRVAEKQDIVVSIQYRDIGFFLPDRNLSPRNGIYIMNTGEIVSDYFAWSDAYEKYYHNDIF